MFGSLKQFAYGCCPFSINALGRSGHLMVVVTPLLRQMSSLRAREPEGQPMDKRVTRIWTMRPWRPTRTDGQPSPLRLKANQEYPTAIFDYSARKRSNGQPRESKSQPTESKICRFSFFKANLGSPLAMSLGQPR